MSDKDLSTEGDMELRRVAPGARRDRMTFGAALWLLFGLSSLATVLMGVVAVWDVGNQTRENLQNKTRSLVETAHGLISHFQRLEAGGTMSREQAQAAAKAALRALRYDDNQYFWINDHTPVMIMHPIKPALEGKPMGDFKDPNGTLLFREFVAVVESKGAGFVGYQWPFPGREEPVDKISYVKGVKAWNWIVGSGVYDLQIAEAVWNSALKFTAIGALILLLIAGLSFAVSKKVSSWVKRLTVSMQALAGGDQSVEIPFIGRQDEIGQMAEAVAVFKRNDGERGQLQATQASDAEARRERMQSLELKIEAFETRVGSSLASMASVADKMQATVRTMQDAADDSLTQIKGITTATEDSTETLAQVSHSSNDILQSINEVASQVNSANTTAQSAAEEADRANREIQGLSEASARIGEVVKLISDIANQTNLLALNATIEAARAGEAGKGFAVVASEVKNLATQTSNATEEIAGQVGDIQKAMQSSVDSIRGVVDTIVQVNEINTTVATAADRQTATTDEVRRGIDEAVRLADTVKSAVGTVGSGADRTKTASDEVLDVAQQIASEAAELKGEIEHFLADVRAA